MKILSLACALASVCVCTLAGQTTVTVPVLKDATLHDDLNGAIANGSGQYFFAGKTNGGVIRRAVIAFDVATVVPAGATITAATFSARCSKTTAGPVNMSLQVLTSDWNEGPSNPFGNEGGGTLAMVGDTTWLHTNNPGMFWAVAGGDFVAGSSATTSVGGAGIVYTWTSPGVIADVQSWLDLPALNFGWLMKGPETAPLGTAKRFDSVQSPFAANRPSLQITYLTGTPASVSVTGTGCVGSSGAALTLGTVGLPMLGNAAFAITFANGPANGLADLYLATSTAAVPFPIGPCNIYLDLVSASAFLVSGISPIGPLPLNGVGALALGVPVANDPSLVGVVFAIQALSLDAGAPAGLVLSNGLTVTFGI
ncbi:MAG: hypothetical protein CMJ83_18310 [Planctomycetes bacterium]|nr:hypothetical protein [Planctomycetota bacterium]